MTFNSDPIAAFTAALERARQAGGPADPTAMALATVGADGRPSCRMVLLKHVDQSGFVFYTNLSSRKARELSASPFAALTFHWPVILTQARIEGAVEPVEAAEADAYFASRPRGHQLAAWASRQSAVLASRDDLEQRYAEMASRYADNPVPRPSFWSGYRVIPDRIEIWTHRDDRLHDRVVYTRRGEGWSVERLYP
jgi:pyridoxamine 5'-phosphate oxidase